MASKYRQHTAFFFLGFIFIFITLMFLCDALFSKHLSYFFPFVSYGGTFKWRYLQLGKLKISLYWSAHIVGIWAMCIVCVMRKNVCKLSTGKAVATGLLLAFFGFVGAKILFIIENISCILQNDIRIGLGGVSFFGTVFFIPLVIPIIGKLMGVDALSYLDYCTPAGIIMLACIRCGCFMRGCCQGIRIWIDFNPVIFPTQLMEYTLDLFLLDYILGLERTHKFEKGRYIIFMGLYGIIRFLIEFLRDTPKTLCFMSNGQWFSIICIFTLLFYLLVKRKARNRNYTGKNNIREEK